MINAAQNSKYFRRWKAVCDANRWRWIKGRLTYDAVKGDDIHQKAVWSIAENIAQQDCRTVTADDLRHACHVHAFGRDISHSEFSNDQFSRLLLLWGDERRLRGLLIYADDLAAQMLWDNPDHAKKHSLIRSINSMASSEYICSITQDVWGTVYWEDLDVKSLLGLLRKLQGNKPAQKEVDQPY